jgi:ABC-type transport system involved in cytochrome c biogenesis permease subunit
LGDNFDTLIWLALLLAGFVLYLQKTKPVGALDWFILPIAVLLLVAAAVFGRARPHDYVGSAWSVAHRLTLFGSALAFFVSGAVGVMYLMANHRLRIKTAVPGPNLGSLERLDHMTQTSVALGFSLLTVGLVTGLVKIAADGPNNRLGPHWFSSPKVTLSLGVWVVYGLVLHTPLNASLRGRKAALLSIVGVVLMVGAIVAVQFMPGGTR